MADRSGDWFLTFTGLWAFPLDVRPEDVRLEDIAHSLSLICRFQGHCRQFYSVAQHSVLVSEVLPSALQLVGLMHDGTEAFCGDMIRPLKLAYPGFREMEDRIWSAIALRFNLPELLPAAVKEADNRVLQTERRDLLAPHPWRWSIGQARDGEALPYDFTIEPWGPVEAEHRFLERFYALIGGVPET